MINKFKLWIYNQRRSEIIDYIKTFFLSQTPECVTVTKWLISMMHKNSDVRLWSGLFQPLLYVYKPVQSINKYQGRLLLVREVQRLQGIYHFNTSVFFIHYRPSK